MKFTVDAGDLAEAIALCDRAIPKRPSRPILGHMLMQLDNGSLTLKGFDEALGISFSLPVDMEQSGDCCISPTYLKPILERLSGQVALDLQYPVLVLTTLGAEYRINTLLAEDYPNLPEVDGTPVELSISSEELRAAIAATVFCASTDESKQVLTGVHFSVTPGEGGEAGVMELAATDGHRMIAYPLPGSVVIPDDYRPVTLPGKSLRELLTVLKGEGAVKLTFDDVSVRALCGDTELYSRVIEGQYPNYRQLFPKVFSKVATCDRKPFLAALDRTLVVAGENKDIVKLEFDTTGLVMSAEAKEAAKAQEHVEGVTCSEPITLAGNGKYIKEALTNAIVGETFTMEMNKPESPVVFTDGSPATYLMMPIQIRG
jgi:DNA polymerase-3 subunit beta